MHIDHVTIRQKCSYTQQTYFHTRENQFTRFCFKKRHSTIHDDMFFNYPTQINYHWKFINKSVVHVELQMSYSWCGCPRTKGWIVDRGLRRDVNTHQNTTNERMNKTAFIGQFEGTTHTSNQTRLFKLTNQTHRFWTSTSCKQSINNYFCWLSFQTKTGSKPFGHNNINFTSACMQTKTAKWNNVRRLTGYRNKQ